MAGTSTGGANRPSTMSRDEFLTTFGRIYEHSPWIAESAWAEGIGPDQDTIEGLHRALRRVVDRAPREKKLALINAHPDLAGRLAVQGELTAESTGEQASAGLDKCTPWEFERFSALNAAYRAKFGFPFIMAVKGRAREEILAAFERRAGNGADEEFASAIAEIHEIARLRLIDILGRQF